jgi:hypothetical protein
MLNKLNQFWNNLPKERQKITQILMNYFQEK